MTILHKKILSELFLKEANDTDSKYRIAHLVSMAHYLVLDCIFDLIHIYNEKFNESYTINNFKL